MNRINPGAHEPKLPSPLRASPPAFMGWQRMQTRKPPPGNRGRRIVMRSQYRPGYLSRKSGSRRGEIAIAELHAAIGARAVVRLIGAIIGTEASVARSAGWHVAPVRRTIAISWCAVLACDIRGDSPRCQADDGARNARSDIVVVAPYRTPNRGASTVRSAPSRSRLSLCFRNTQKSCRRADATEWQSGHAHAQCYS